MRPPDEDRGCLRHLRSEAPTRQATSEDSSTGLQRPTPAHSGHIKVIMQISLTQEQTHHLQNRFFKNVNDAAKNDFEKASYYFDLYKMVGAEGFASFLKQYFNYTPDQIKKAEARSKTREMFSSRRLWMRVGGRKGIEKLIAITDEEKRTKLVDRITQPKGIVNYSPTDLDRMIESGDLVSDSVTFYTSRKDRSDNRRNNRSDKRNRRGEKSRRRDPGTHKMLQKLEKTVRILANNQNKRQRSRGRQTSNV
jgi:hypothetical protein